MQNKPKNYIILFTATTISQIPAAINNIQAGRVIQNGVLTFSVVPIVCAVLFLGILAAIVCKMQAMRKEDAEE